MNLPKTNLNEQTKDTVMRTGELTQMVISKYGAEFDKYHNKHVALTQVRGGTGWGNGSDTTSDVMVLGSWPSSGQLLEGFEVKVSRADWLNEVKCNGEKAQNKCFCDKWWLVIADESMVKEGELFDDWGMMAVVDGKLKVIKEAPPLTPKQMTKEFVSSLLRHNEKEYIPIDVVNDRVKDAIRQAEANSKEKYAMLLDYVKTINKTFGITMEFHDKNKNSWLNATHWTAKVRGRYSNYTDEELVKLISASLNDDLKDLSFKITQIKDYATRILESEQL